MRIVRVKIENFRGIAEGEIFLTDHAVLVGDNNVGKSTILEAIDLVLGPERLSRRPVIDEHDFYGGRYLDVNGNPVEIKIELVIVDLSSEQKRLFNNHLEWWSQNSNKLLDGPPPENTDQADVVPALRVGFKGGYDREEDDFIGGTYFLSPKLEVGDYTTFKVADKRQCGFLFLRTLRTGSRALSLERGSLLDIILRLQEKRFRMWEDVLENLRKLSVAENKELCVSEILSKVEETLRTFIPSEHADSPHMRVSDLTRESLRRTLTVFMCTGIKNDDGTDCAAPFQHQGTGTINMLVLALLSMIAELKQNVIFAMEEPETAIPPHTQKAIIDCIRKKSSQSLFTSHSPYVLEEFDPLQILVLKRENGKISGIPAGYPPTVKPKAYRSEIRKRFCEALLARRVLILEGRTEYDAFPSAARRLQVLDPVRFKTLEAMGIAVIDAESDTQIAPLGSYFSKLGKTLFAIFDQQTAEQKLAIQAAIANAYESPEHGFEDVVLNGTPEDALKRFALSLVNDNEWPQHLNDKKPTETMDNESLRNALRNYLIGTKGASGAADLLAQCSLAEMPKFIVDTLLSMQAIIAPVPVAIATEEPATTQPRGETIVSEIQIQAKSQEQ